MDREIALMKRYQKDANIIAYVHCNTIVLIKREISEDSKTRIFEIIVNLESEKPISKRAAGMVAFLRTRSSGPSFMPRS